MARAGALYLILVGFMLCLAGGVFTWLMWRSFMRASDQRQWAEVSCQVLEVQVRERQIGPDVLEEYGMGILYGYDYGGASFTSEQHSLRGVSWSSKRERAEAMVKQFPEGSEQVCYVNPDDPEQAVLELDSKAPGYSLWFPVLIVAGGLGIITGAVRGILRKAAAT